jgi:hypothetical protein
MWEYINSASLWTKNENVITEDVKYMGIYPSNFTKGTADWIPSLVHSYTCINEHCNSNKYTSINNTLHL